MAKTEKEIDDAVAKAQLAAKLIQSARNTAQVMGVGPAPWMYAIINEMALVIVTQAGAEGNSLEVIKRQLGQAVEELKNNPRIVADASAELTRINVILIDDPSERDGMDRTRDPFESGDDDMQQVREAIAKGAKQR